MPTGASPVLPISPPAGSARARLIVRREACLDAILILGALIAATVLGSARPVLYLALALMTFGGPAMAIRALSLGWLITMINGDLAGEAGGGALRNLFFLTAFASVTVSAIMVRRGQIPKPILYLLGFAFYAGASGALLAFAPDVAVLKALLFAIGAMTVIWAFRLVADIGAILRWFRSLTITLVLVGFPLIVTDLGYAVNGKGFQGLLNQPQAYGAFLGIAMAWLGARWLFERDRSVILTAALAAGLISLVASEARVGFLTFGGALGICFLVQMQLRRHRSRAQIAAVAMLIAAAVAAIAIPGSDREVRNYVYKSADARDLGAAFQRSRGFLLARSYQNIRAEPVFGIGFGMPSIPALLQVQYDPILGLPTGAAVEKGFAVIALIEETGLIGTLLFVAFFVALARPVFRSRDPGAMALFSAAVLSNFGEATLFSFGGNGMVTWLFLGLGTALARQSDA